MTTPITDHAYRPDRAGQWHTGRCDLCGEPRNAHHMTSAPATRTADDVFERPPWCGTCDEWTRKVEVEIDGRDAMQNCARCHPLAVAS